jgi:hypothetical protein
MVAMIPTFAERSHFDSVKKVAIPATGLRRVLTPKTVGIAIALFDLAMMLVNPMIWRDVARRNARLALVEKVGAIVPSSSRLFAVPEVPGTDVIVIAYRLERRIDRKLITCADRNDYFLLPIASGLPAAETKVLATSEGYNVALVSVLTEQPAAESQNNSEKVPSLSTNEQKACAR